MRTADAAVLGEHDQQGAAVSSLFPINDQRSIKRRSVTVICAVAQGMIEQHKCRVFLYRRKDRARGGRSAHAAARQAPSSDNSRRRPVPAMIRGREVQNSGSMPALAGSQSRCYPILSDERLPSSSKNAFDRVPTSSVGQSSSPYLHLFLRTETHIH